MLSCRTTVSSAGLLAAAAALLPPGLLPARASTTVTLAPEPLACSCSSRGPSSTSPDAMTASAPQRLAEYSSTVSTGLVRGLMWSFCVDGDAGRGFLVAWDSSQGLMMNTSAAADALLVLKRVLPVDRTQYRPPSASGCPSNSCWTCGSRSHA